MGAVFGFLVGTANGAGLIGLVGGAVIGAALAFVLVSFVPRHRTGTWATSAVCGVLGLVVDGGFRALSAGS